MAASSIAKSRFTVTNGALQCSATFMGPRTRESRRTSLRHFSPMALDAKNWPKQETRGMWDARNQNQRLVGALRHPSRRRNFSTIQPFDQGSKASWNNHPKQQNNAKKERTTGNLSGCDNNDNSEDKSLKPALMLQDVRLPCSQHLDPNGNMLPTSEWIHINGTLPLGSLHQILNAVELMLQEEEMKGIIDLDAQWNPVQDPHVPLVSLENLAKEGLGSDSPSPWIEAAHVVLSPFGRPNGWHLKLCNRSLVYAILARAQNEHLRVDWKAVQVRDYQYSEKRQELEDPGFADNDGLVVDDSMVRIENCPPGMDKEYVRHLVSRYELALEGNTILQWKGKTNDGLVAPLMFVVRFADASWARAAVRELQSTIVNGKKIKLVQYPKQIRYKEGS